MIFSVNQNKTLFAFECRECHKLLMDVTFAILCKILVPVFGVSLVFESNTIKFFVRSHFILTRNLKMTKTICHTHVFVRVNSVVGPN